MSDEVDLAASVEQAAVVSTVAVSGPVVTRTYSDGAIQRLVFETDEMAASYAASASEVEGNA